MVDKIYRVEVAEPFDIVVASCGGFPHDVNLIQVHKGMHHASRIVKEGGRLVFCGEAREGVGSMYFEQWFDFETIAEMAEGIRGEYTLNAHTAYAMREKAGRMRISLQSLLMDDFVRRMGIEPMHDMQHEVNEATAKMGSATVAIIPNANLVLPVVGE
jgi:nickel-dependent lactate racemase